MKNRASLPESGSESDEDIRRKIDELRKDPEKFREYIASRLDRAVKNWPRH